MEVLSRVWKPTWNRRYVHCNRWASLAVHRLAIRVTRESAEKTSRRALWMWIFGNLLVVGFGG